MIGNDIVDLAVAEVESNWRRKGYLDKIFTMKEQLLISKACNPEIMVWMLWSRKEACYKIFNRQTHIRIFNPIQFECSEMVLEHTWFSGTVQFKEIVYHTKTEIKKEAVYTVAVENESDFLKIRELGKSELVLKKDSIPYVYDSELDVLKPASVSHHGRFTRIISI